MDSWWANDIFQSNITQKYIDAEANELIMDGFSETLCEGAVYQARFRMNQCDFFVCDVCDDFTC